MFNQPEKPDRPRWPITALVSGLTAMLALLLVRWHLHPVLGERGLYSTFLPAVMLAAYFGDLKSALLVTLVSALISNWFLVPPEFTLGIKGPGDLIAMIVFVATGAFIGLLSDLLRRAQRSLVEEERRRAKAALRQTEERFEHLIQGSSDIITHFTAAGTILYQSPSVASVLGHRAEDRIGRNIFRDPLVHPEDVSAKRTFFDQILTRPNSPVRAEFRLRHADGSWRNIEAIGRNLLAEPSVNGIVANYRDVTERKRVEAAALEAREIAVAANRAKDAFLANVSHEIRTPMNAILGMTELTLATELREDQRQCLATVHSAATNLMSLLNDLLDFSKIEAGRITLDLTEFSLKDLVGDVVRTLSVRAHQKHLELICQMDAGIPDRLLGDAGRIRQILFNLIDNAIKFTDQGEVAVEVGGRTVPADRSPSETCDLRIAVRDTGIGIPPEKQAAIFRAFEQEDASTTRRYGGTGLGLTIATRLAELMGGGISLASRPGEGSTFALHVCLPVSSTAAADGIVEGIQRLEGLPVLIVDDNASNRRLIAELLRDWSMQPMAVATGREALVELSRAEQAAQPYRLVLLDSRMPEMDGLALAAEIRQQPEASRLPLILLTSGDYSAELARARELDIRGYLIKPVQPVELLSSIQNALPEGFLPDAPSRREPLEAVSESASVAVRPPALNILLAEDNEFNVRLLQEVLRRQGHAVEIARTGTQVLERLRRAPAATTASAPFDLLLLDIHMPELDGLQVIRRIREQELLSGEHLPVIALTARSRQSDRDECIAAGVDDYLSKPVNLDALQRTIARLTPGNCSEDGNLLDAAALWSSCGGDGALLDILRRSFCESLPQHLHAIDSALAQENLASLREAAHKFHGTAAAFSSDVARRLSLLEDEAAAGRLSACRSLADDVSALATRLARDVGNVTIDALRQALQAPDPSDHRRDQTELASPIAR